MQPDNEQTKGPVVSLTPDGNAPAAQLDSTEPTEAVSGNQAPVEPVRWQASEYSYREKNQVWSIVLALITIVLIIVAIFVFKSPTFAILVPVMAAALFIYTRRPPQALDYTLSRRGLYINDQLFPFSEFKSFTLMQGVEMHSIMLIPVKRFKPAVTINFPEEVGEVVVDMLATRLPMGEVQPDIVDQIIRRLHL